MWDSIPGSRTREQARAACTASCCRLSRHPSGPGVCQAPWRSVGASLSDARAPAHSAQVASLPRHVCSRSSPTTRGERPLPCRPARSPTPPPLPRGGLVPHGARGVQPGFTARRVQRPLLARQDWLGLSGSSKLAQPLSGAACLLPVEVGIGQCSPFAIVPVSAKPDTKVRVGVPRLPRGCPRVRESREGDSPRQGPSPRRSRRRSDTGLGFLVIPSVNSHTPFSLSHAPRASSSPHATSKGHISPHTPRRFHQGTGGTFT